MEKTSNKVADLTEHAEQFVETWYKLTLLNLTQKSTMIASASLTAIVVFIAGLFVLLLGGIALSLWLGNLVGDMALGFLLGASFFIVVTVVIIALRKRIIFPYFRDLIIRKLYDKV
jgi:hypothetical protein